MAAPGKAVARGYVADIRRRAAGVRMRSASST